MPPPTDSLPLGRRIRHGARQQRAILSGLVLAIGTFLIVLAVGFFTPLKDVGPFPAFNAVTAPAGGTNYNLLFLILGPIVAIVGGYLVGAYLVARRRFDHLMLTKSKAEFLRNIPEIEDLLWELTPTDETRYEEKRAELRVRR